MNLSQKQKQLSEDAASPNSQPFIYNMLPLASFSTQYQKLIKGLYNLIDREQFWINYTIVQINCIIKQLSIDFSDYFILRLGMGNKVGFEANKEKIKVVVALQSPQLINLVDKELTSYITTRFQFSHVKCFQLQCLLQKFLSDGYQEISRKLKPFTNKGPSNSSMVVQTNRETIKIFQRNTSLRNAFEQIFNCQIELQHKERMSQTIKAFGIFEAKQEFYTFANNFKLSEISRFETMKISEKEYLQKLPSEFLLIFMKNGVSYFSCKKSHIEKIDGSILGEQTLINILKFKIPHKTIHRLFDRAFDQGNVKKTDLFVDDIYGKGVENLGLPKDLLASSMGKLGKLSSDQLAEISDEDIARSVLTTFAINTGIQISVNLRKQNLDHALFLTNELHHCENFYRMIQAVCGTFAPGKTIIFSQNSPFLRCIGTALANDI